MKCRRCAFVLALLSSTLALFAHHGGQASMGAGQQAKPDVHDPAQAVANLDVHPQLRATLFASEPTIVSPTNLDIDHRGRVWVCEVVNYRRNAGKRPEGDRILILEDTDGDGVADKTKVFYQGRDIDSAMGICVLGDKVIVSASPDIFIFYFDPATDKVLKQERLFTKTGQPQHDHSAHSFVFGPDGKLYWNFGNTGKAVHDRNGKLVVDLAGHAVVDNGKPYHGGMVFRCNMDGTEFETLAHNFRNNYEVAVDSFGTLWQSDNDDDGNRGVRINYVMEYGNFGYLDEMTGAGWRTPRTNMEAEIPLRHWHLNDPGVVPNLLQTYAGSPTGICVYEGTLLPRAFQGQIIHCDAGPSVVRAYPVQNDGAGYKAEIVNILDGRRNNWFRPADVAVAPDGSLFVTDWYDPGVGGHGQGDLGRGRIFRVAPPGHKYAAPKFDFTTANGCVEALRNPNLEVRYLAWTTLHGLKEKAEPALLQAWSQKTDPRYRARALWLLGQVPGRGADYVGQATRDADPDIRITGIRLARLLKMDMVAVTRGLLGDPSPQVRRECAIALRFAAGPQAAHNWAELARQHDGKDRWYLEALGIGAARNWDAYLNRWLQAVGGLDKAVESPAGRDILWRSRAAPSPAYLAAAIRSDQTPTAELPRFFRAFDFQPASELKDRVLTELALGDHGGDVSRRSLIAGESLIRLRSLDLAKNPEHVRRLHAALDGMKGTQSFVDVVGRFHLSDRYGELLTLAQQRPEEQLGAAAMETLLNKKERPLIRQALEGKDVEAAVRTAKALGSTQSAAAVGLLSPLVTDAGRDIELRRQAVRALARSRPGCQELVRLARARQLPEELKQLAGFVISMTSFKDVRAEAAALFPLPEDKHAKPFPPVTELVKMKGSADRGRLAFEKHGTCNTCHVVKGQGKEVGPDLSDIGKKLSREALFESILFPSASISHNYEMHLLETQDGNLFEGVLVSQTPEAITLKGKDGLARTFKRDQVFQFKKSALSLMPADLNKSLTAQDVVDLVEYMQGLR